VASKSRPVVLKNRSDFQYIQKFGKRLKPVPWLLLNYLENEHGQVRCGWTLPRKVGSAVVRNRLKRWSREYFRAQSAEDQALAIDINLVFRQMDTDFYKKLDYEQFGIVMDKAWKVLRSRCKVRS
jgi:ribonuclease P protein component